jgi:hypothetical protein
LFHPAVSLLLTAVSSIFTFGLLIMKALPLLISASSVLVAACVLVATVSVAWPYDRNIWSRWLFLLPIAAPFMTAVLATWIGVLSNRSISVSGCVWGVFVGANLLLLHQGVQLALHGDLLRNDGTSYWALLSVPICVYGPVLIGVGALVGSGAVWAWKNVASRRA